MVFKTNIYRKRDVSAIKSILKNQTEIINWNIDLMDCDKVLRIETKTLNACQITQLILNAGFQCQELED